MGGYLHLLQVDSVRLEFLESPIDFLNDLWSQRISKAYERAKMSPHQVGHEPKPNEFPCPFRSITFGFDYWINQPKNQTETQSNRNSAPPPNDAFVPVFDKNSTIDSIGKNLSMTNHQLSMSVCDQTHQEQVQAGQWMYAAVRLNLDHMTFQRYNQMVNCVQSIFAQVKCGDSVYGNKSRHSQCVIQSMAFKNIEIVYEYKEEEEEEEEGEENDHPDGRIDVQPYEQENASLPHAQLKYEHVKAFDVQTRLQFDSGNEKEKRKLF